VVEASYLPQLYDAWSSQAQFGLVNDVWSPDSEAVQVLLPVLLQYGPSRPMQTPCDLLELESMEPVFSTLTPQEFLVLLAVFVSVLPEQSEPYSLAPLASDQVSPEPLTSEPLEPHSSAQESSPETLTSELLEPYSTALVP
jgi:hypothetical protein